MPALWNPEVYGKGVVTQWLKKENMSVKKGETICIITAAKVRVDVTSYVNGKIVKILAGEEVEVEPGDPLAEIEAGN